MKLTQHISLVWLLSLLLAITATSVGFIVSVNTLILQEQEQKVGALADQATHYLSRTQQPEQLWGSPPDWLDLARNMAAIQALDIRFKEKMIYQADPALPWAQLHVVEVQRVFSKGQVVVRAGFNNPWFAASWSWQAITGFVLSLAFIVVITGWSSRWFRARLSEVDTISLRAQRILKGEMAFSGDAVERPRVIRRALDYLLEQLSDAPLERSRFDSFMRSNTFLDPITGLGNRLYFDNQLESAVREQQGGYVLLLQFQGYDLLCQCEHNCHECYLTLKHIGHCLKTVFDDQGAPCLSRRHEGDFAVLLREDQGDGLDRTIKALLHLLEQVALPARLDPEHSFHVGVAALQNRMEPYQALAEADMALRAAQVQEVNTWFMYQRDDLPKTSIKGSVRWRTLLEDVVRRKSFVLSTQPVVSAADMSIHHYEVLLRLRDEENQLLPAHVFLPMAKKCGMSARIDQVVLEQLLKLMRYDGADRVRSSINLSVDSLLLQSKDPWLMRLLEQYQDVASQLIVEVAEYPLFLHLQQVKTVLLQLKAAGCLLAVDQVGQNVVNSHYVQELGVDILKLHASLVRCIDARSENQLFIRSLAGACENTHTKIFALAVEQQGEWRMLKRLGVYGGQGHLFTETTHNTPAFLR